MKKIRSHKINSVPVTKRSKRGGKRKIQVIISENRSYPPGRKLCLNNLNKINTDNVYQEQIHNIRIGYMNAQSCRNKTEDIVDLILEKNMDILFITETWLAPCGDEVTIANLTPPSYVSKSVPRPNRRGGGIAVIYRNILESKIFIKTETTFDHTTFEAMELSMDFGSKFFNFVCIYHPPYSKTNRSTNASFIKEFENLLVSVPTKKGHPVLLGDFNFHFDSTSSSEVKYLKQLINQCNMTQIISTPTHRSGHVLDWVIIEQVSDTFEKVSILNKLISDHNIILLELDVMKPKPQERNVTSRNIKGIDITEFKADVIRSLNNIQTDCVDSYNDAVKETLHKHAPLVTRRLSDRPYAPWYSLEVKSAKTECRKAERMWLRTGLHIHKDIFRIKKQIWKQEIRNAKKDYYVAKFQNSQSSKQLFGICGELLGKVKETALPIVFDDIELPDKFAFYFNEKVQKLRNDLDCYEVCNNFEAFEGLFLDEFEAVSDDYVKSIILKAPHKHCELDPIPSSLLLTCIDELVPTITNIINTSLLSGSVPESFKTALVKPLLKKQTLDPNTLKNYRPVSNLPFLSKILEKVILQQFLSHLQANNLLETFQSAYRTNHSTETALLKVMNDMLVDADSGKVVLLSLLDLSAAFDTIDHHILLKRLETTFGITGSALRWFESYLSNRHQAVVIKGKKSANHVLKYGVPQGSVLGPILFTIYTQPLAKEIEKFHLKYHFYADDTQIYGSALPTNIDKLVQSAENCIISVKDWMNKNKLMLNDDKTEAILAGSANALKEVDKTHMIIGDSTIKFSRKVKNLGIHFDADLSMSVEVNHLIRCMYLEIRKIGKIRHLISTENTTLLVNSLVLSKLDYCNSLLAGISQDKMRKLKIVQNNAARLILKKNKRESASPLLQKLHWLPVEKRIMYKLSTLCHRIINDKAPSYLKDLVKLYIPSRTLRSSADTTKLRTPKMYLKTMGERSFAFCGPQIWNSLPQNIRETANYDTFKRQLKTHFYE